jgi:hypothetical protein
MKIELAEPKAADVRPKCIRPQRLALRQVRMDFRNHPHQFLHVPNPCRVPRPRVADEVTLLMRWHLAVAAEGRAKIVVS